jgi:hypothetical protein
MTYACPAWEFAAETHLLKLQRVQNRIVRTIGNFPRHTAEDMKKSFIITKMKLYAMLDKAKPTQKIYEA